MRTILELNTGHKFIGKSFGKEITEDEYGEIVFQTGMVGYPESLTDPSYLTCISALCSIFPHYTYTYLSVMFI